MRVDAIAPGLTDTLQSGYGSNEAENGSPRARVDLGDLVAKVRVRGGASRRV
jgi:hypothetical protein